MADRKIELVFNAKADITEAKSAINQLVKTFEGANIKIPQSISKSFNATIQSLFAQLDKLDGMTDIELAPKDAKTVTKDYEKLTEIMRNLFSLISSVNSQIDLNPEKFFPDKVTENITKATKAIEIYNKALLAGPQSDIYKNVAESIAEANKQIAELTKKQNKSQTERNQKSSEVASLEAQKKALNEQLQQQVKARDEVRKTAEEYQSQIRAIGSLTEIQNKLRKQQEKQNSLTERAAELTESIQRKEAAGSIDSSTAVGKDYEKEVAQLQRLTSQINDCSVAIDRLKSQQTQIQDLTAPYEKARKSLEQYNKEITALEKQINSYQNKINSRNVEITGIDGSTQATEAELASLKQQLQDLIDERQRLEEAFQTQLFGTLFNELEQLGIVTPTTERSIDGLVNALKDYKAAATSDVANATEKAAKAVEKFGSAARKTGDEVNGLNEKASDILDWEKQIEGLKDQILQFFSIQNTIQLFKNAIQDAFDTVKELDAAMTETAVVTDFSIGDMWEKLPDYSARATELGASIRELYEATTLYYQQGLNTEQSMSVGIETMKMARVANMDAADATKAMTAALRGFNMEINETSATRINDVYSELAA